ncbi:MAG TPA: collagen-like protein [Solirubrobacterales bacterium]|nr:collagen-like protein [Solirubrobacterales bacterium]
MHENRRTRRLPSPATVLASIAVFAVLAGSATAATSLINGKDIKKGTITGKQVKNKSLSIKELSKAAVKKLRGATGPRGEAGARGATGARGERGETGARGPAGIVAPLFGSDDSENVGDEESKVVVTVPVATTGTYVINAKTNIFALQATIDVECNIEAGGDSVDFVQWTAGEASSRQPVALQAVAPAAAGQTIELRCFFEEGNGSVFGSKVTAIPVS